MEIGVQLPNLRAGRALFRAWETMDERAKLIGGTQAKLAGSGLCLEFHIAGRIAARLGTGARPGLSSWLIRPAPAGDTASSNTAGGSGKPTGFNTNRVMTEIRLDRVVTRLPPL